METLRNHLLSFKLGLALHNLTIPPDLPLSLRSTHPSQSLMQVDSTPQTLKKMILCQKPWVIFFQHYPPKQKKTDITPWLVGVPAVILLGLLNGISIMRRRLPRCQFSTGLGPEVEDESEAGRDEPIEPSVELLQAGRDKPDEPSVEVQQAERFVMASYETSPAPVVVQGRPYSVRPWAPPPAPPSTRARRREPSKSVGARLR